MDRKRSDDTVLRSDVCPKMHGVVAHLGCSFSYSLLLHDPARFPLRRFQAIFNFFHKNSTITTVSAVIAQLWNTVNNKAIMLFDWELWSFEKNIWSEMFFTHDRKTFETFSGSCAHFVPRRVPVYCKPTNSINEGFSLFGLWLTNLRWDDRITLPHHNCWMLSIVNQNTITFMLSLRTQNVYLVRLHDVFKLRKKTS